MIIPVWVDEKKDKTLIEFLSEQTNKSATVRNILYSYLRGVNYQTKIVEESIDNEFINSLDGFEG